MFSYSESYKQQGEDLGDNDGGEYSQADGFLEVSTVGEHLYDEAEAGKGEDACQSEAFVEGQSQGEIQGEKVGGDSQGGHQGYEEGNYRCCEVASAYGGEESAKVNLVEADEEEEDEDADGKEEVGFGGQMGDAGNGAEDDAAEGVGYD